ncbi:MAG: Smr/MutS family protein [Termitinemataceae bacterium]
MNERTLRLLEFDTIRQRIAACAVSEEAAAHILQEEPRMDTAAAIEVLMLVQAFVQRSLRYPDEPRAELPSIGTILDALKVEGLSLDQTEIYALGIFIQRASVLQRWITGSVERFGDRFETARPVELSGVGTGRIDERQDDALFALAAAIPDCSSVETEIFKIIDRSGMLRDLSELREIRSRLQALHRDLEQLTNRYISNEETRRMLQSDTPSQRDGRIVLPVKANFKGRIKGIVHEVSATGQTIFIEPEDIVEKNNEIVFQEQRLAQELARIFRELTRKIAEKRDILVELHDKILYLETLRARARYSLEIRGVFAFDPGAYQDVLVIKQGRHPLLGSTAVPIDLFIDKDTRTVVITGPNTGGKTVTLKTVGLFTLMNQFGVAVPAAEGTVLPFVDGVYADIGDEQSISQSLSTFSAHMTNIASIIQKATEHSLVLLDELGSGTDPEEGSAIAMALLDHCIETGCRVFVTTHHSILKNYGYSKPGVQNASVEFDKNTLSPTYRIIMGIPGESRALEIAQRNGLPPDLVRKARSYLDEERSDVSALIAGLKEKHRELDLAVQEQAQEARKLREERRKADLRELKLRQKELELKKANASELRRLLTESRKTLENLVREVREGELTRDKTLAVKEFLAGLEQQVRETDRQLEAEARTLQEMEAQLAADVYAVSATASEPDSGKQSRSVRQRFGSKSMVPLVFKADAEVLYGPSKRRGRLVRQEKKGFWIVEFGAVKMQVPEQDLTLVPPKQEATVSVVTQYDISETMTPKLELNIRGERLEDALELVRKQIEGAALTGLYEFSIIHGKGDGILQRGVHEYLKQHPLVADYYFASPEQGGFGKTQVVLKR